EADDVMGILATRPGNEDCVIVARDKDMKTLPAKVWDGSSFKVYLPEMADYWHMYQTLTGDTADGYKGCPGIGPKKAEAILNACTVWHEGGKSCDVFPMWPAVLAAFANAGLTEADALLQARLARILRWSDWCSKTKTPRLWSPPSS